MANSAAFRTSEADMARVEARYLLARSKLMPDSKRRRPLPARALELAVQAEQMDGKLVASVAARARPVHRVGLSSYRTGGGPPAPGPEYRMNFP
jgi:hypothetical protein